MNTPEDDPASVADSRDLTLAHLRAELASPGLTQALLIVEGTGRVDAEHSLAAVAGAFGAIGRAS